MPSPDFAARLQCRAEALLDRDSPLLLLKQTCDAYYEDCLQQIGSLDTHSTALDSGRALSADEAARCVQDFARTTALIRAVDAAIQRRLAEVERVHVLYAGCGPFAALLLPLLARYPAEHLQLVLVDVHAHSLANATALIEAAGVADRLQAQFCADATSLRLPEALRPDVLVAEVMQRALQHEPQLQVLAHLLPQCAESVELVPERIRVSAALADIGREFDPGRTRLRVELGELLELSKASLPGIATLLRTGPNRLPCPPLRVPSDAPAGLSLILRTHIQAGPGDALDDYDSGLSYPMIVHALGAVSAGECIEALYRLGADPGFELTRTSAD